jgi:hypothetical protein
MIIKAACDSLMIIDCCHAITATRRKVKSTNEVLAASVRDAPSYQGRRAYSKLLTKKLKIMRERVPFTVYELHEEMEKHSGPTSIEDPEALLTTPAHGFARATGHRIIRLDILPRIHGISNVKSKTMSKTQRVFMEIELNPNEKLDAGLWQRWFAQKFLPPSI